LKVFGILKTFSQKGLKRVKGRALAHPLPDKSKFEHQKSDDARITAFLVEAPLINQIWQTLPT
jgi:hypothetical protein